MALTVLDYSWIMVIPIVPSVLVAIFVLYHLLVNQVSRTALNNHVIILLVFVSVFSQLTTGIWHVYFYRTGMLMFQTSAFCFAWTYCGSLAGVWSNLLMTWASIERHILIFHPNWVSTKIKRLFVHYLPLFLCILWPLIFYFIGLFIIPCDIPLNYSRRLCNRYNCILRIQSLALIDSIGHSMLPSFLVGLFSLALFVRVIHARYRIRRRIDWRKYKKLATQLLSISTLYTILQLPPMILYAAYSAGMSRTIASDYYAGALTFSYWVVQFTPFVTVLTLPDLQAKCRNLFLLCQERPVVAPVVVAMIRSKRGQTATIPATIR